MPDKYRPCIDIITYRETENGSEMKNTTISATSMRCLQVYTHGCLIAALHKVFAIYDSKYGEIITKVDRFTFFDEYVEVTMVTKWKDKACIHDMTFRYDNDHMFPETNFEHQLKESIMREVRDGDAIL